jgi:hypothetical protein
MTRRPGRAAGADQALRDGAAVSVDVVRGGADGLHRSRPAGATCGAGLADLLGQKRLHRGDIIEGVVTGGAGWCSPRNRYWPVVRVLICVPTRCVCSTGCIGRCGAGTSGLDQDPERAGLILRPCVGPASARSGLSRSGSASGGVPLVLPAGEGVDGGSAVAGQGADAGVSALGHQHRGGHAVFGGVGERGVS